MKSDLDILGAAESCMELHGGPLGPVVLGSFASCVFRGGYHRQPGLPRFGVCQDVSRIRSKIFEACDSPSLSRLCQDFVEHLGLSIVESKRCYVV